MPQTGTPAPSDEHDYLRRLSPEFYRGTAYVHWTMSLDDRRTGWLDTESHLRLRDLHAHTLHRYGLICPVYCLMPDHVHLFWIGVDPDSDQRKAARFFRDHGNDILARRGASFQKQGYDNVLKQKERERDAVLRLACYIAENPARAGLVPTARDWPFSGSHAIGYPDLDWRVNGFGERFWKIFALEVKRRYGNCAEFE